VAAVALVVIWAASGPFFGYSESWQLVINTGTTIITFLMVFVLQNSQNRDGKALQAKLDELILSSQAHNKFVGIEKLSEDELREGAFSFRLSTIVSASMSKGWRKVATTLPSSQVQFDSRKLSRRRFSRGSCLANSLWASLARSSSAIPSER
jgi:low affinity Fe/Cu permease